jgi:hypothetical protein
MRLAEYWIINGTPAMSDQIVYHGRSVGRGDPKQSLRTGEAQGLEIPGQLNAIERLRRRESTLRVSGGRKIAHARGLSNQYFDLRSLSLSFDDHVFRRIRLDVIQNRKVPVPKFEYSSSEKKVDELGANG